MLVVSGEARPLWASWATCVQRSGSTPGSGASWPISASHAQAIRQGSRIAASPPGMRTGQRWPMRSNPVKPPRSSSPPHTVPSVP